MTHAAGHLPVLLDTVLRQLAPAAGETAIDLTAGRGGHAEAMARAVGPTGRILLCDLDAENLAFAADRVRTAAGAVPHLHHGTFALADRATAALGWRADCALADLGFASTQMDDPARGFSFQADAPLDMRLDASRGETAAELLARLPERELADSIFRLGEDPFARRIARVVADRRLREPIRTTQQLAVAVVAAYGAKARQSRMHPATRTFMALRILVNDELGALRGLLSAMEQGARAAVAGAPGWLAPGARLGIISFHSLEDREVKHAMAAWEADGLGERLTRKPAEPSDAEVAGNRRARSAKFRAFRLARAADRPAA
ncbi:MAG: 16S rRNA (cytosine(1402)-N(4))-methyltransferase RsmH [Planctomycetes bacterium]|nr:16S rRNA (cytosine(1402)-N(4))-methyltransferase RsmH [Planctomycetota bacterium]